MSFNRYLQISVLVLFSLFLAERAQAVHLGLGLSSSMDGRPIPAINAGFEVGNTYLISGSSAGVQTKAYYHSSYTLSFLKWMRGGKTLFGMTNIGLGAGVHYGKKGWTSDPEDEEVEEQTDSDFDWGPAFRMAVHPFSNFFVTFDFVMGLGGGVFGLGFADSGVFAFGITL